MFDFEQLLLPFIFAVGSLLHGITGIGVTLVTTGSLASMYPLQHAIILTILPSFALNLMTWLIGGERSIWGNFTFYLSRYWLLALMSLLGSLLGVKLLMWVDSSYILLLLAAVIAFYVASNALGKKIILPATTPVLIVTGLIAGIIGGSTNAMSTILLMYLLGSTNDKNTIAKVGNMCYLLGKVAQIIVLRESIVVLPKSDLLLIAVLTTTSIAFLLVGIRLRRYLSQQRFRQLVLLILTVLGIRVGWQGIIGLI